MRCGALRCSELQTRLDGFLPIGHHRINLVDLGGEGTQPNFLRIDDELRIGLLPLMGNLGVLVGIDEKLELARLVEQWQEGDARRNLPDDRLHLSSNLALRLVRPLFGEFRVSLDRECPTLERLARFGANNGDTILFTCFSMSQISSWARTFSK